MSLKSYSCLTIHLLCFRPKSTSLLVSSRVIKDHDFSIRNVFKQRLSLPETARSIREREGAYGDEFLWPHGIAYYRIDEKFFLKEKLEIFKAMQHITHRTCIRFQQIGGNRGQRPYVYIKSDKVCNSAVGFQNTTKQYLHLMPFRRKAKNLGCMYLGAIVHELLHTLGFYHQHNSSDRDNYVRVLYANIQSGEEYNFVKFSSTIAGDFGVGYDYSSIMHYDAYAFSKNDKPTIVALKMFKGWMGHRLGLSENNIKKINRLYKCNGI